MFSSFKVCCVRREASSVADRCVKETSCESSDQLWLNCIPRWLREAADGVMDALDPKKTCLAHVGV
jgi:hypothetical protein